MKHSQRDVYPPLHDNPPSDQNELELDTSQGRSYNLMFVACLTSIAAIGGFLFGYDTGVVSGATLFLNNSFTDITIEQKELVVSVALAGAAIGSFFGGPAADKFGRKITIYISDFTFTIGTAFMGFATDLPMLILGRFFVGIGVGAAAMVIPVYLAEISPKKIRGAIVTINNLLITFGQFLATLICVACGENWRLMLGLAGIPSILQFIGMIFLPESPKWLMKKNQTEKAEKIMKQILRESTLSGQREIQYEMESIAESVKSEGDLRLREMYKQLFTTYKRSLFVGVMLQVWQQLAGINTAMYYGPSILQQAGLGGDTNQETLVRSIPLGLINFLGTIVAVFYTDKLGRRWMMLRCLPLLALCMSGLSLGMFLLYFLNQKGAGTIVGVASLFLYLAFFSPGMGSQPWTVNSEIYPLHLRATAVSISTTANWATNYAVSAVFLTSTESDLGKVITYFLLGFFCVLAFVFIYYMLPETKGKSLDEIIMLFKPGKIESSRSHSNEDKAESNDETEEVAGIGINKPS